MPSEDRPLRLLISFAPADRELKDQLVQHLQVLVHFGGIELWEAGRVRAGDETHREIARAIDQADVALLLLSADFFASDGLIEREIPQILERHRSGKLRVVPVILRSCLWEMHPWLKELDPLPKDREPIASRQGDQRDRALKELAKEIFEIAVPSAGSVRPIPAHTASGGGPRQHDLHPIREGTAHWDIVFPGGYPETISQMTAVANERHEARRKSAVGRRPVRLKKVIVRIRAATTANFVLNAIREVPKPRIDFDGAAIEYVVHSTIERDPVGIIYAPENTNYLFNVPESFMRRLAGLAAVDPAPFVAAASKLGVAWRAVDLAIEPSSARDSPILQEIYTYDAFSNVLAIVFDAKSLFGGFEERLTLYLFRNAGKPPFSEADCTILERICPHLREAITKMGVPKGVFDEQVVRLRQGSHGYAIVACDSYRLLEANYLAMRLAARHKIPTSYTTDREGYLADLARHAKREGASHTSFDVFSHDAASSLKVNAIRIMKGEHGLEDDAYLLTLTEMKRRTHESATAAPVAGPIYQINIQGSTIASVAFGDHASALGSISIGSTVPAMAPSIASSPASRTSTSSAPSTTAGLQSVYLSYAAADESFVERLFHALEARGVATFYFPEHGPAGVKLGRVARVGINGHDRVVLLCSRASLADPRVLHDLDVTLEREAREGASSRLIPVNLDNFARSPEWQPSHPDVVHEIQGRVMVPMVGAERDTRKFEQGVEKLIRALKG